MEKEIIKKFCPENTKKCRYNTHDMCGITQSKCTGEIKYKIIDEENIHEE